MVLTMMLAASAIVGGSGGARSVQATAPVVRDTRSVAAEKPASDPGVPVPLGDPGQWFGPDAYPPAALRAGAQGRVVAQVDVDRSGHVTGCNVTEASGSADLDATTCGIATQRMTFIPAHDVAGRAIGGQYRLPIRWVLPRGGGAVPVTTTLVSVGGDGAVLSCSSPTPTPLGDLCAAFPVGRKLDVPEAMRGRVFAIGAVVRPLAQ